MYTSVIYIYICILSISILMYVYRSKATLNTQAESEKMSSNTAIIMHLIIVLYSRKLIQPLLICYTTVAVEC